MNIVPHIDVVGDDRIQAILDDPRNFNLRAIRAETIAEWVPDLGTYLAGNTCRSQNGVFRTPGLAASGIPATLRHRFWKEEDAARITGTRYIGLLIYDDENDDYTFEIMAGADPVGAVRPWRHDNRRHLIACSQPAHILGGYIPFTVRAVGKGPCYLESIVFMPECPEPSLLIPDISRLSVRIVQQHATGIRAQVHFVTAEAAATRVEAINERDSGDRVTSQTTESERLHALELPGLRADSRYRVAVTATERGGAAAEAHCILDTTPVQYAPLRTEVPVEIVKLGTEKVSGLPLTFGVPLPAGRFAAPQDCTLVCDNDRVSAQTRVHSRWPDGSARWVLVDVPCPAILDVTPRRQATVLFNTGAHAGDRGLHWRVEDNLIAVESSGLRVTVCRGAAYPIRLERRTNDEAWQDVFATGDSFVAGVLGNGLPIRNGMVNSLVLQEAGPQRAVIRFDLPLLDDRGMEHFRMTVWLHVYAQMPFVHLVQRTVVTSPSLGPAFPASKLDRMPAELERVSPAAAATEGEATSLLTVQSLEMRLPWRGGSDQGCSIVQEHDRAYRLESALGSQRVTGRWPGFLTLGNGNDLFALCIRHFWQTYPKGVRHDEQGLAVTILPKLSGEEPPDYADLWHKLYFWYDETKTQYRLKAGMALRTDVAIGFPGHADEVRTWHDWLENPVVARPDIGHLNQSNALLTITPKASSPHPRYEAMLDRVFDQWTQGVEDRHEYGFMNFGDTYSDAETFWSNNEYDAAFWQYMEFLRGGDPRFCLLASRAAQHTADIDTCNYSRDASQIGGQYIHIPGHVGGYLPPFFRSKMAGSRSQPSHSFLEGEVLHYLLTGDETVGSVVRQTGFRLTRGLRYYDFRNARECGWHLVHLCGVARMEDDPRLLNAAAIIVSVVLEKQEPTGGWEHPLAEAHCLHEPPRCHGEAGFMVGVLLAGLRRYYSLAQDQRVAEAIIGGARWLAKKIYLPDLNLFRYTSCPVCRPPGRMGSQLTEGLAMAYSLTRDEEIGKALHSAIAELGELRRHPATPVGYGQFVNVQARYAATTLHMLEPSGAAG